jgi:hypothetical protein
MVLERFNGKIQAERSELYINDIKSKVVLIISIDITLT